MCIVSKLSDKLSALAAMVENRLLAKHDLVYFVREYSWDNQSCWIDGCIDGHTRVSFLFGEELEGGNGIYLTISHEGGENHTTREYKLDKSLEEQTDDTIRIIADGICQMVTEYYTKANKLRDNLDVLADMLKCSLRAKYRRGVRVEKLKSKDSSSHWISCTIGYSMRVSIDYYIDSKMFKTGHGIGWCIVTKDDLIMTDHELSGSLDEQDESTIRAIANDICQMVAEYHTEDNK